MDEPTLTWCKRLIGCRSVTHEGTREIAEMCARELLAPIGIVARLLPSANEGAHQVNLMARIRGTDANLAPLVLNTHLDTVPPGDPAGWSACGGDPFAATIADDRIYGLGAADTKLDFLAKVMGLRECGQPRREVYLVATFGEERGLVGAKELAAAGMLPHGGLAFIGEPSRLQVIVAHKGLMVFELRLGFEREPIRNPKRRRLRLVGRTAHSSTPALGQNAIRQALDAIVGNPVAQVIAIAGGDAVNKVPAQCEVVVAAGGLPSADQSEIESAPGSHGVIPASVFVALSNFIAELQEFADRTGPTEQGYAAPTLTCNPGVINSSSNSITLEFELRPPPSLPLDKVQTGIERMAERMRERAGTSASAPMSIELTARRANPGFRSGLETETVELAMAGLAKAGLPLESGVKAGCTEAGIYAAAGLSPVVIGPGPSTGVIHAPNEYNFPTDVEKAIRFYAAILRL